MGQLCSCARSQAAGDKLPPHSTMLPEKSRMTSNGSTLTQYTPIRPDNGTELIVDDSISAVKEPEVEAIVESYRAMLLSLPQSASLSPIVDAKRPDNDCSTAEVTPKRLPLVQINHASSNDDASFSRSLSRSVGDVTPLVTNCRRGGGFDDVITCASSSSAASSSIVTSDGTMSLGDDEFYDDDVIWDSRSETLKRKCTNGTSATKARKKLACLLRHVVELIVAAESEVSEVGLTAAIDRMLRHAEENPCDRRPRTAAITSASVCYRLDDVISCRGLDVAVQLVIEAFRRTADRRPDGSWTIENRFFDLLVAIELLDELLTSDAVSPEVRLADTSSCCRCGCDDSPVDNTDSRFLSAAAKSEVNVQLVTCDDDVIDDGAMLFRLGSLRGGPKNVVRFERRSAVPINAVQPLSIAVRFVGWCLCSKARHRRLVRLLSGPCVTDLSLVKTNVAHGFDDASPWLADALRDNCSLLCINFRLSSLADGNAAERLGESLSRHRRMRRLNVAGTGLDDRSLADLMRGLAANKHLVDLDIGFNDFSKGNGCSAVADVIARRTPPLRRLRMRDDGLSPGGVGLEALLRSVSRNSRLRLLDLSGNQLGDDGVRQLSAALIVNRTLRDVLIENCGLGPAGCSSVARALRANCSLRALHLSRNAIGDHGFASIADGLRYNRSVTSLGANQCSVGNAGLYRLLEALEHNLTVVTVKLCYNHIGSVAYDNDSSLHRPRGHRQRHHRQTAVVNGLAVNSVADSNFVETIRDTGDVTKSSSFARSFPTVVANDSDDVRWAEADGGNTVGVEDEFGQNLAQAAVYNRLKEVLHSNAKLKILLWGNRMDGYAGGSNQQIDQFNAG